MSPVQFNVRVIVKSFRSTSLIADGFRQLYSQTRSEAIHMVSPDTKNLTCQPHLYCRIPSNKLTQFSTGFDSKWRGQSFFRRISEFVGSLDWLLGLRNCMVFFSPSEQGLKYCFKLDYGPCFPLPDQLTVPFIHALAFISLTEPLKPMKYSTAVSQNKTFPFHQLRQSDPFHFTTYDSLILSISPPMTSDPFHFTTYDV